MAFQVLATSDLERLVACDGCPAGQVSRSAMRSVHSFRASIAAVFVFSNEPRSEGGRRRSVWCVERHR